MLAILVASSARSQQYGFTSYSVEDGLAQSQVTAVLQDREGYLWAGTHGGGLSRFDGVEFRTYTTADGLAHDRVRALYEDRRGWLWIGTHGGLSRFDGRRFQTSTRADGLPHDTVRAIVQDQRGRLWLATDGGAAFGDAEGFHRPALPGADGVAVRAILEDRAGRRLWLGTERGLVSLDSASLSAAVPPGAPAGPVNAFAEDREGHLWIGTEDGVLRYDGRVFEPVLPDGGRRAAVHAILEDSSGNLWLGTRDDGVWRYDGRRWARFTESEGLPSNTVWALAEDREGQIWLGTYRGGLSRYQGEIFVHYTADDGLGDDVVRTILEDRQGRLVFGTYRGGLSFYDGRRFERRTTADGLAHDFVLSALEDRSGTLWIGTFDGLSRYRDGRFRTFPAEVVGDRVIRALFEDHDGVLWIGTNANGLTLYDGQRFERRTVRDGLPGNSVAAFAEDPDGGVWIATLSGAARFDGEVFEDLSGRHPFLAGEIYSVLVDRLGELWLAVFGLGILHFTPAGERLETFTRADGLKSHGVVSLVEGADGDLWIGTEAGLHRLDMEAYRQRGVKRLAFYGRSDGFQGIECLQNAAFRDSRGRLWFGTLRGAARYDPRADVPSSVPPLVHLNGVRLFLEEVDLAPYARGAEATSKVPASLVLPHHQNHVTFDFAGIGLRAPAEATYRVRLRGFDKQWLSIGDQRHFTYSNLPPGDYLFEVDVTNGDGLTSRRPATARLRIRKPFWQRTDLRLAVVLAVLGALFIGHRWRLRRVDRRRSELEREVETRTGHIARQKAELARKNAELEAFTYAVSHDLRSPLFTFKGFLKLIEKDLDKGRMERVRRDLERLHGAAAAMGELLADLLDLSRAGRVITRREEIAFSELAAETVRRVDGALRAGRVRVELPAAGETLFGDRLRLLQVLQNLVENAIKFMGDQPRPRIRIGSREDGGETTFFVEDNGIGIEPADQDRVLGLFQRLHADVEGTGVGLTLVQKIVETHGGRLWIESQGRDCGTRACFTLPRPSEPSDPAPRDLRNLPAACDKKEPVDRPEQITTGHPNARAR